MGETIISSLDKMDAVIVLIVVLSSQILSMDGMKDRFKPKFLVPLAFSVAAAVGLNFMSAPLDIAKIAIKYAGSSMLLFEFWKNIKRSFLENKSKGGTNA